MIFEVYLKFQKIVKSHETGWVKVFINEKVPYALAHIHSLLFFFVQTLSKLSGVNVYFFADIGKTFHLNCCLFTIFVQSFDCGLSYKGNVS